MNLRTSFLVLWPQLRQQDDSLLLLGGFALLLKQEWLRDMGRASLIPLREWTGEAIPRTTHDIDVGVSVRLIADAAKQQQLQTLLENQGFVLDDTPSRKRWAWVCTANHIALEFHASRSDAEGCEDLEVKGIRVKNRRLRGKGRGVHGFANAELVGMEKRFVFEHQGTVLAVPHALIACMMKLKAFADRYEQYRQDPIAEAEQFYQYQKHARDVMRILAMLTPEEERTLAEVLAEVETGALFQRCRDIVSNHFSSPEQVGCAAAAAYWRAGQLSILCEALRTIFRCA